MSQRGAQHRLSRIDDWRIIQFGNRLVSTYGNDPEKQLAAAVLLRAMQDFFIGRTIAKRTAGMSKAKVYADAAEWFSNPNDDSHPYTFLNICSFLNLDSHRVYNILLGASTCQPTIAG